MKRGQITGQVFIYIMALVLISIILFYGFRVITSFTEKGEQVSQIQFKNELQNAIRTMTVDFGSVKVRDFNLPSTITQICFVKNHPTYSTLTNTPFPLIEDAVNSGVDENVYLIGDGIDDSFLAGKIDVSPPFTCIRAVNNQLRLRLEGKGNHVLVSQAS